MSIISRTSLCLFMAFAFLASPASNIFAQGESVAAVNTRKRVEPTRTTIKLNEAPRFPGCDYNAYSVAEKEKCAADKMEAFIQAHLEYPEIAKQNDFKPRIVRVEVTVKENGKIHSPRVLEPGIKDYDAQAQMVFVKMMQDGILWKPGVFEGKAVSSPKVITVHFNWEGRYKAFPEMVYGEDIFEYVDEPAAFSSCQVSGIKDKEIRACVQERMAEFFVENMEYPSDAHMVGIEGDVEVEFVVGKTGKLKDIRLKNDIGLGCGDEALRLVELMNEGGLAWVPGQEDGQQVNVLEKTTVKFRTPKENQPKTKLAQIDARKVFITERKGYEEFLDTKLHFPKGEDINLCAQGVIDVKFKVAPVSEDIVILDMVDYNNLGKEFRAAATNFLEETSGEWNVSYPNLSTETTYQLSIPFISESLTCPRSKEDYKQAIFTSVDGAELAAKTSSLNDGLAILDDAVRNFPADNKLRHLRGLALYQANRKIEACVDLSFVSMQNKDIPVPKACK